MRKILFLLILFLFIALNCQGSIVVFTGGSTAPPSGPCALLSADFEGETDGTDLSAIISAWSNDGTPPADAFEIDTAQFNGGAASAKIEASTTGANRVYRTFAEQTTGTVDIEFYFRSNYDSDTPTQFLFLTDGAQTWDTTYLTTFSTFYTPTYLTFRYFDGAVYNNITGQYALDTWHHFELQVDLDTDTFDLSINSTAVVTGGALINTGLNLDRIYLDDQGTAGTNRQIWMDSICIN